MAEEELETNGCEVELDKFFSYVVQKVCLTLHEAGEKQKEILKKLWHYAHEHLIALTWALETGIINILIKRKLRLLRCILHKLY